MINEINYKILLDGVILLNDFNIGGNSLFLKIKNEINWDLSIKSRKTASFGVPYDYSNINYDYNDFPNYLLEILNKVEMTIGYKPNNCLINYYYDSQSKMGYHSDQIDILEPNTGIVILSLGNSRIIRFKNKLDNSLFDIKLYSNTLLYMTQETQKKWMHSILPGNDDDSERISITFRRINSNNSLLNVEKASH